MKLSSFKSILLKKAEDNPTLLSIIDSTDDSILLDKIIESLEKMARPAKHMGQNANSAITSFAGRMSNRDVEMMRDALGHHISAHKAELAAGNREAADAHLNKIVPLMHLAARAAPHSGGKLDIDYVPLEPWETNYTTLERRPETGKLKEGTKGLRRRPSKTDRSVNPRGVPDFRYLEMKPHGGHSDMKTSLHKEKGYPFEEIQVGSPTAIDAKQAYLPIRKMEPTGTYRAHPFDDHPVHKLVDLDQASLSPDMQNNFASSLDSWIDHDSSKKWNEAVKQAYTANPEEFKKRGKEKPEHHFSNIDLLDQPESAKGAISQEQASAIPPELRAKFASKIEPSPQSKETKPETFSESHLSLLPPELAEKFKSKTAQAEPTKAPTQESDEDIISAFDKAPPQEKLKLWPKYKMAMDKKHGAQ